MRRWIVVIGVVAGGCTAANSAFRGDEAGSSGSSSEPTTTTTTTGTTSQDQETDESEGEASSSSDGIVADVASAVECSEEQVEMIEWCMAGVEWMSVLESLDPGELGRAPWREDLYLPCIAGGSNKYFAEDWLETNGFDRDPATAYFEEFCGDDGDEWWCADTATYDGSVLEECAFRFSEGLSFDEFGDPRFDAIRNDLREVTLPGCGQRCVELAFAASYPPATGPTLAGDAMKWVLSATLHRFVDPEIRRYEDPPFFQLELALESYFDEAGWEFATAGPPDVCSPQPAVILAMQREARFVVGLEFGSCD